MNDSAPTWQAPPHLIDWLIVASKGLCSSAKDRIREEISEHYREVLAELEEEGGPVLPAPTNVIDRLGSAKAANRRYRKVFVTESEEKHLKTLCGKDKPFGYNVLLLYIGIQLISNAESWLLPFAVATMVVLQLIIPRFGRLGWKMMLGLNLCFFLIAMSTMAYFSLRDVTILEQVFVGSFIAILTFYLARRLAGLISKSDTYPAPPDRWGSA